FRLIAINPNDDKTYPDDSFKNMQKRAKQKGFEFPYLRDETQEVARAYGAKKTPEVFLLERVGDQLIVRYVGAIDDNYKSADDVEERYVEGAVDAILAKETVDPNQIPAVGCGVKYKKS
ncbi:MAG: redoxin domain-containing protein, partial [Bacteroidota bacterium]